MSKQKTILLSVLVFTFSFGISAYASMTFNTTTITSDGALNLNPTSAPVTVNGDLTVTGTCTGCGGGISITSNQLAFGSGVNTIGGSANLTYDNTNHFGGGININGASGVDRGYMINNNALTTADGHVVGAMTVWDTNYGGIYIVGEQDAATPASNFDQAIVLEANMSALNTDTAAIYLTAKRAGSGALGNGEEVLAITNNYGSDLVGVYGNGDTKIAGTLTVGPDESTLDSAIENFTGGAQILTISKTSDPYNTGIAAEVENTNATGNANAVWGISLGAQSYAVEGDAVTNVNGGSARGGLFSVTADGAITADNLYDIYVYHPFLTNGASATNAYGLFVDNVTQATNNWAIRTGLGKVEFGDVVKIDPTTFSSLTTCNGGAEGTIRPITDSNSVVFNATITGGGANHVIAYCNGTNWTVH